MQPLDSPAALNALRDYLEETDRTTASRGDDYFQRGRVGPIGVESDSLFATVRGSQSYEVSLIFTGDHWQGDCTCPVGGGCKHCHALALAWRARRILRQPSATRENQPPAGVARTGRKSFREQWSPIAAQKLGRPLASDEARLLGHLSAIFQEMKQHWGRLHVTTLRNHQFDPPAATRSDSSGWVYGDWWDPLTPPSDPWELWQYLAYDYERAGQPIPEVFRPFTDTTRIRDRLEARLLETELKDWRGLLLDNRPVPGAPFLGPREKPVAGLRLRLHESGRWLVEVRTAPDKPFKEPTQKWMRGLGVTVLAADFASLSPAESLLGALLTLSTHAYYGHQGAMADNRLVETALAQPAIHPALALPDGSPLQIAADPLAWQAVPDPLAPDRLRFELVDSDNQPVADARPVSLTGRSLYLWQGKLHPGPPPLGRASAPLQLLDDDKLRHALRERAVRLPASLALKFKHVPARAVIECDVTGDSDATSLFRARLLAVTDDPPTRQSWTASGWNWLPGYAPPRRKAGDPVLEIDRAPAHAVGATFADFRLRWFHSDEAWTRPLTRTFPEEFLAWRATLPAGTEFKASPELAGLLGTPLKAHADFSATPAESSGVDWFDLTLALRVEDSTLTPEEIGLLLKARGKWVRLPRHGWQRLELATGGDALATLDRLGLSPDELLDNGRPSTHRLHALQLAGEADAFAARDAAFAENLRQRLATLAARPAPALPASLKATLRPYQLEGFHYLAHLSHHGFGGVLADDMGLGKTVQTLAWLLHLAGTRAPTATSPRTRKKNTAAATAKPPARPFRALIVCPKSVVHGWLAETARFAPTLAAIPFTPALASVGPGSARGPRAGPGGPPGPSASVSASASAPTSRPGVASPRLAEDTPTLIVAHYTQLRLQAAWFQQQSWDAVVLDEAQFIKNPASKTAAVARSLPAAHRLVLTGTPVENRLLDLWSLFAFAQPGLLGTQAAFKRQHPDAEPASLSRLRRRVRHFMLRRTKGQVATDLPARTEDEIVVDLEDTQRLLYDAELKRARAQLLGVQTDRALDSVRFNILASLLRLRQICCHPALIDPAYADTPSAKLDALLERLDELRDEGHQVLVFSQFVQMLEIIRNRLGTAGIPHLMLTGQTDNRAELVEKFQTDRTQTVFLLSLKAAGFGLNLTAASYAILYDPWWNPAVEAQAIDRAHRIGQTQPVVAYRILAADTIEEKIRSLQRDKAALASAIVQEESLARVLDLESLRQILA